MTTQEAILTSVSFRRTESRWGRFGSNVIAFARAKPLGAIGAVILTVMVIMAVFAPMLEPYNPITTSQREALQSPGAAHLFGTDQFGRDILSRVIRGARISLYVGLGATVAAITVAMSASSHPRSCGSPAAPSASPEPSPSARSAR